MRGYDDAYYPSERAIIAAANSAQYWDTYGAYCCRFYYFNEDGCGWPASRVCQVDELANDEEMRLTECLPFDVPELHELLFQQYENCIPYTQRIDNGEGFEVAQEIKSLSRALIVVE